MNFFEQIVNFLSGTAPKPPVYGWFHLLFIVIFAGLTVFICVKLKKSTEKTYRRLILISWIIMVVFEVLKQLVFSFSFDGTTVIWDFWWEMFPFQLCSTPLYLLPFIVWLKEGNVRDSIVAYIATFSLLGGLITFLYPASVFNTESLLVQIQTMIHHGLQITIGIFSIVYYRKKWNIKYFLKGTIVFGIMTAIAMILNLSLYPVVQDKFNMFYISPYVATHFPVFDIIYASVPYVIFLLIYLVSLILGALIIYFVAYGIIFAINRKNKKVLPKQDHADLWLDNNKLE